MDQLQEIVSLIRDVLGPEVLGGYLHGSFVSGGPKPASDVDVLAVTRRSMDEAERKALLRGLTVRICCGNLSV